MARRRDGVGGVAGCLTHAGVCVEGCLTHAGVCVDGCLTHAGVCALFETRRRSCRALDDAPGRRAGTTRPRASAREHARGRRTRDRGANERRTASDVDGDVCRTKRWDDRARRDRRVVRTSDARGGGGVEIGGTRT